VQRKLTITIADDVYQALHDRVGRGQISRFIEGLVRPHVVDGDRLEAESPAVAAEPAPEYEPREWIDAPD
jgi:hypothetical protein